MSDGPQTPRDWLLARHAEKDVALTALRRAALPPSALSWREALRELFLPHRRVWQAFAAVWLLLAVFHVALGPRSRPVDHVGPPPEVVARWLAQFSSHEIFAPVDHPR